VIATIYSALKILPYAQQLWLGSNNQVLDDEGVYSDAVYLIELSNV
jgi:hypothetical protein